MIDYSQFGAFAIVFVLMGVAIGYLIKRDSTREKKIDDLQEKRLQDAKESRDQLIEPMNRMTDLTQKVYDAVIKNSKG